jgi:hypothetical protein
MPRPRAALFNAVFLWEDDTMQKIKPTLLGFVALICAPTLYPMDWPATNGRMISNFGWNDGGSPALGVSFQSQGPVATADEGELLFIQEVSNTASQLPEPLGNWVAVDHGDIISLYSHMDTTETFFTLPRWLSKDTAVGMAGRSGWADLTGFSFSLFDRKERRWVNPSMIMTPLPDTRPPVIQGLWLKDSEGRVIESTPAATRINQGRYTIIAAVVDTQNSPTDTPLAPHRIVCTMNGTGAGELTFETYSARDGVLMVYRNGLVPVRQVYALASGYEIGETLFTRGQISLEITAYDIIGLSQSAVYRFAVE